MNNDLISREELKKEFARYGEKAKFTQGACQRLIDNAETVEQPTGEWVHREDMDFIDENHVLHQHFMCRKCGFIHDFIDGHTSQYKFCPQCGYRLKFDSKE